MKKIIVGLIFSILCGLNLFAGDYELGIDLYNNKDYFKNVGETIQNTEELGINLYKGVGSGLKFTGDIAKSAKDFYTLGEKLYKLFKIRRTLQ